MPLITSGFMDSVMGRSGRREKGESQEGGVAAAGFDTATNTQSDPLGAAPDR